MGVDDVGDAVVAFGGEVEIGPNVELRVDDGGLAGLARGQEVRGAAGLVMQELLEVHVASNPLGVAMVLQDWRPFRLSRSRRPRRGRLRRSYVAAADLPQHGICARPEPRGFSGRRQAAGVLWSTCVAFRS